MKKLLLTTLAMGALLVSCSKDQEENQITEQEALVGLWQLTDYKIDTLTTDTSASFQEELVDALIDLDCDLVTFEFKEDASLEIANGIDFIGLTLGESGLEIDCPTEKDITTTVFSYEDSILTYKDESGEDLTIPALLEVDTLIIDAKELYLPNFDAKGELIFTRF